MSMPRLVSTRIRIIVAMLRSASNQPARAFLALALFLSACAPAAVELTQEPTASPAAAQPLITSTPLPARPLYDPGQLVDYTAQSGDTLIALATRFNTSIAEILEANPVIPQNATTLPPGLPMRIPIYYRAFWGSAYPIIPDSLF